MGCAVTAHQLSAWSSPIRALTAPASAMAPRAAGQVTAILYSAAAAAYWPSACASLSSFTSACTAPAPDMASCMQSRCVKRFRK